MKIHELKCHIPYYAECVTLRKTFEVRKNDRDFKINDVLFLNEYDQKEGKLTGLSAPFTVTYIFKPSVELIALMSLDACAMSIMPVHKIKTAKFHLYNDSDELKYFTCSNEEFIVHEGGK